MNSMVIFHSKMVIVQRFIPVDHAIFGNMWLDMFQKNMEHMMGQPKKNGDFALLYIYTLFLNGTYLVTSKKKTWSYVIYIYIWLYIYWWCSVFHIFCYYSIQEIHGINDSHGKMPRHRRDSSLRGIPSAPSARLGRPMKLWI